MRSLPIGIIVIAAMATFVGCNLDDASPRSKPNAEKKTEAKPMTEMDKSKADKLETATLAGGCFWCLEAVYAKLKGVEKVQSGYSGGSAKTANYEDVCSGTTGHAEVVQITFDPTVLKYEELLEVFFSIHDPTTLNRQGNDAGTQYRSAIFYHSDAQKAAAEKMIKELTEKKEFSDPIVTEVTKLDAFYQAEKKHDRYYELNPNAGYCRVIISPKVEKFKKKFADKVAKP